MADIITSFPHLRAVLQVDKERSDPLYLARDSDERQKRQCELEEDIVGRLLANRNLAVEFARPEVAYLQNSRWWWSQTLYHAFMMLISAFDEKMPDDWAAVLKKNGIMLNSGLWMK